MEDSRVTSGVSAVSERDRAHLRQISDATVSSVGEAGGGDRVLPAVDEVAATTPTASGSGLSPVHGTNSAASPLRRSVFHESVEDMGSH